jgi:hypothetical protein
MAGRSWPLVGAALVAACSALKLMSTTTDWLVFWTLVAASATVFLYLIREFFLPLARSIRVRFRAVRCLWCITSSDKYVLKYAAQDSDEHELPELVLPSRTEDLFIHILIRPRVSFRKTAVEYAIERENQSLMPPVINFWYHPFVARGVTEKRPDRDHRLYDRAHYVDYHGNYHINEETVWPRKQTITSGFKINTHDEGVFMLKISIVSADGITAISKLPLRIETAPYSVQIDCKVRGRHHRRKKCTVNLRVN